MVDRKQKFIDKSTTVHNGKYDYSKVEYVDSLTSVVIICPEHGEFKQTPQSHARGNGCPICANIKRGDTFRHNKADFIKKANKIHKGKYNYDKVNYINSSTDVIITCPIHSDFKMLPAAHLQGQGCPKCSGRGLSTEDVIKLFIEKHKDKYQYSKVSFTKMHDKVIMTCPIHGDFEQTPSKHLLGQGCPICAKKKRSESKVLTNEEFIEKANKIHKGKYDYSETNYVGTYDEVDIICKKHGKFKQRANDHLNGHGCQRCGNIVSLAEDEIVDFITNDLGIECIRNDKTILGDGEIDILIPSMNIGIEYDGLKWHSEEFKDKKYHLSKSERCLNKGIRLIHIFEDEWVNKKEIVKDKITSTLKKTNTRIYARKCHIKVPTIEEKRSFLIDNHIQGDVSDSIRFGLYYNNELVALMTFGKLRLNLGVKRSMEGEYELLRYCTKLGYSIVGGASKLLNEFISKTNPKRIISYCDRRYSEGNMYVTLGFTLSHISEPNYYYVFGTNRHNRFKYRKSELVKKGYDKDKSEHEIMLENKVYRIYDCGNLVFEMKC